jgi:hypothetical protein
LCPVRRHSGRPEVDQRQRCADGNQLDLDWLHHRQQGISLMLLHLGDLSGSVASCCARYAIVEY